MAGVVGATLIVHPREVPLSTRHANIAVEQECVPVVKENVENGNTHI